MPNDNYSSHLKRLEGRPGEKFQYHLVEGFFNRVKADTNIEKDSDQIFFEIGPGAGRFARKALEAGFSYSCTEITQSMRDQLSTIYQEFSNPNPLYDFRVPGAPTALNNAFSAVVAIHVFEHNLNHQDAREFLADCFRILKPGGSLIILCPDYQSYGNMFWDVDWSHSYPPTKNRLKSIIVDVGFQDVQVKGIRGIWSNPLLKILLAMGDKIFPVRILDFTIEKFLGIEMLATGASIGYLKQNLWAVAKKPQYIYESR